MSLTIRWKVSCIGDVIWAPAKFNGQAHRVDGFTKIKKDVAGFLTEM